MQLACIVSEKHEFVAFHYLRSERKKHVRSMNNNLLFFHYQTAANYVLIKTQSQSRTKHHRTLQNNEFGHIILENNNKNLAVSKSHHQKVLEQSFQYDQIS